MAWISKELKNIYYGQQCSPDDIEIPDAPGQYYNWIDGAWVHDDTTEALYQRHLAKQTRADAVAAIKVTVGTGREFDGDEASQTRMSRAIIGMQAAGVPTITWTLADNSVAEVTLQELTEALILAGQRQAELWSL